jgi:hypothetical protein
MKKQKLNQIIAIEKGIKSRVNGTITEAYHAAQKPSLFEGLSKTYAKKNEDGEDYPPESSRVQKNANELVRSTANSLSELFDATATKDFANCSARADVEVDGKVLLKDAPATYLLFLEKQLTDFRTFLGSLPVLDPSFQWDFDENASLYKTPSITTARPKKVHKAIVLYPATEKHPAQTQLIQEDVIVGHWKQVRMSGAIQPQQKAKLLKRVEKLQKAVKFAREEANSSDAPQVDVGEAVFGWILE